jgi:lipid-A-disaccharide synthase
VKKRVLILSGEASGDLHGARLVEAVTSLDPNVHFYGMGGAQLAQAGVEIVVDSTQLAVVGLVEILSHFKPLWAAWKKIRNLIKHNPPDLLVLIDYPGFNLQMARLAKKHHIKVLYYISPQVWAWKKGRVKTIRRCVDKMLVIFPFEEKFYQQYQVNAEFVGHPLVDSIQPSLSKHQAQVAFNLAANQRVVGLLPGSRKGEIQRLMPVMMQAAARLKKQHPDLVFLLPLAVSLTPEDIAPYLDPNLPVQIIQDQFNNVVQLCDAAIVASGTATLQTALLGTPMVVIYKTTASTYFLAKRVIKIPFISLCNIVAEKLVVKELIQQDANPDAISQEINQLLVNDQYTTLMRQNLKAIKEKLGSKGAATDAAQALLGCI